MTEIARYDFVKIEENKKIGKYCYHFLDAASLILREIADKISASECYGCVGPGNPQLELASTQLLAITTLYFVRCKFYSTQIGQYFANHLR